MMKNEMREYHKTKKI